MREKAGKKKDGKRKNVQQKEGKRVWRRIVRRWSRITRAEKTRRLWISRRKMAGGRVCNKRDVNG